MAPMMDAAADRSLLYAAVVVLPIVLALLTNWTREETTREIRGRVALAAMLFHVGSTALLAFAVDSGDLWRVLLLAFSGFGLSVPLFQLLGSHKREREQISKMNTTGRSDDGER